MSGDDETLTPKGNARFGTTRWSMVIRAGDVNAPDASPALEELCKSYWYPLYVFVRKTEKSDKEAKKCEEGCQVAAASAEMFRQNRVAYPVERMTGRSQVRAPFGPRR